MYILSNIPFAISINIVVLGILWAIYKLLENYLNIGANKLYIIATTFQFIATITFISSVFGIHLFAFDSFTSHFTKVLDIPNLQFYLSRNQYVLIGIAYFISLLFFIAKMAIQYLQLNKLRTTANYTSALEFRELLAELTSEKSLTIKVAYSASISAPIVFGFIEPIILLPISICNQLSINEVKQILIHEVAHILRNDYLMNIFIQLTQVILWFNPFSYWLIQSIQLQREIACDNFVINCTGDPINYTKALYNIANFKINTLKLSLAAYSSKSQLLLRVRKINGINTSSKWSLPIMPLVCLFILLATTFITTIYNKKDPIVKSNYVGLIHTYPLENKYSITRKAYIKETTMKQVNNFRKRNNLRFQKFINQVDESDLLNIDKKQGQDLTYNDLLTQTKEWIKTHENPIKLTAYQNFETINNDESITKDSIYALIADKLLINSIIKSYQLKKAILEKRLDKATDINEATDYLMNSKEWEEMQQYEKWTIEFNKRQN
jgi:beta-lactamase regulating signal transducer with metallopeptidase domain